MLVPEMMLNSPLATFCHVFIMNQIHRPSCNVRTIVFVFRCCHGFMVTSMLEETTHLATAVAAFKHLHVWLQVLQQW